MSTYDQCLIIINDKKKLSYLELNDKWAKFKEKYPQLYNMLTITEIIDFKMLEFMCNMSEKQTELSKEDQLESDFVVGDMLAKKYIYNDIQEPTNEQKEFIKESLRKKLNNN